MDLGPRTKLNDLLAEEPRLLDFLAGYRPEYAKLRNPVLRKTVGSLATLESVAAMGGVDISVLIDDISAELAGSGSAATSEEDPSARRRETMKGIVRDLHGGVATDELKARFAAMAAEVDAGEIAAMEQSLIDEGVPAEEIKRMCDLHVEVFKQAVEPSVTPSAPAGHPVDTLLRENAEAKKITAALRAVQATPGGGDVPGLLASLAEIDKHYLRKEHQLFPFLEQKGVSGPSSVMWALHDDIRAALKQLRQAAKGEDDATLRDQLPTLLGMVDDMVYKEEHILLPLSTELLSEDEWAQVRKGEPAIGYSWIPDPPEWPAAGPGLRPATPVSSVPVTDSDLVPLTTGVLSPAQIDLMMRAMPLDVSFVDEEDRVRFYSEGDRVFVRSPAVIGRRVQDCHPPKSLDKVQAILDAFRAGEKDDAEFWIEHDDRFVHIRYIALRDKDRRYRGTLETVQDATGIRGLEGERRLLDW